MFFAGYLVGATLTRYPCGKYPDQKLEKYSGISSDSWLCYACREGYPLGHAGLIWVLYTLLFPCNT